MAGGTGPVGPVLSGRYRLTERMASGGMGDVWRAVDERLGRQVAVKVLKGHLAADPAFRERFRFEARAAAGLNHPSIAAVFDYGEELDGADGPMAYLVMELVEGEPLEQMLVRRGRIGAAVTLDIVAQTASGLQAAHEAGIVHRDVKPANLMIRPDGAVKITDFGIARALDRTQLTQTGTMLGTVEYMAPEQLAGRSASGSSDLYALGVVAYRCLAGRTPFNAPESMAVALAHVHDPVPPLPADVPVAVGDLVTALLAKDPAERPPSASAVAALALDAGRSLEDAPGVGKRAASEAGAAPTVAMHDVPAAGDGGEPASGGEPTRVVGAGTALYPGPATDSSATDSSAADSPAAAVRTGRLSRKGVVLAVALGALALLAGLLWATSGPGSAIVPDVHGVAVGVARSRMSAVGLRSSVRTANAPAPAGTVVAQQPAAGMKVPSGGTVTVTVASGLVDVSSTALVGQTQARVEASLAGLGLRPSAVTVDSGATPGTVVGVAPEGLVPIGTTVTLEVAVVPPPTTTTTTTTGPGPASPASPGQQGGAPKGPGKGPK